MGGAKNLVFKGLTAASARKFLKPCQGEAVLALPEPSSLPGAVLAGSRPLPSLGLAVLWVSEWLGHRWGAAHLPTHSKCPWRDKTPRRPGGGRTGTLDNWVPAGVDTANRLRFPFAEAQSGQTQEGRNKGPDSRDQPPKRGPQRLCQEAGSIKQLGECGPQRWD